ncbi:MAG TPA: DNA adenine methylase [Pyrinomonadaceae bacterium]|nr:DNA adenine methylase [Pyrinomonadaceae bacterium]
MTYAGGKGNVYHQIINLMPPHDVYIEPFMGGASIMRMKRPAAHSIGVDRDGRAVEAFKLLAAPNLASGAGNGTPSLETAMVEHGDGIEFLRRYDWRGGELVYCDPPYLMETRSSKRRIYACEMSVREHRRLLDVIRRLPCMVIISGYDSELYRGALAGWNTHSFNAVTRSGRVAREFVWYNYPPPFELHDYRYLGENFRERARINKKKKRWRAKLANLPPLERHAIFSAIEELRSQGS